MSDPVGDDGRLVWPPAEIPPGYCAQRKDLTQIDIPGVVRVGAQAFEKSGLTGVVDLPSVQTVKYEAFKDCGDVTTVRMPNVQKIGFAAFKGCEKLTGIILPQVQEIDYSAFEKCNIVGPLHFPQLRVLRRRAFAANTSVTEISLPLVRDIEMQMFYGCTSLQRVEAPNATTLKSTTFFQCFQLSTITFPKVKTIGENAFAMCSSLQEVDLPEVTRIGMRAFYECKRIKSLVFPKLENLGAHAMLLCESLERVFAPQLKEVGSSPFLGCPRDLVVDLGPGVRQMPQVQELTTQMFRSEENDPGWTVRSQVSLNGVQCSLQSKWAVGQTVQHRCGTNVLVTFMDGDGFEVYVNGDHGDDLRAAVVRCPDIPAAHADLGGAQWSFLHEGTQVIYDTVSGEDLYRLVEANQPVEFVLVYGAVESPPRLEQAAKRQKTVEAAFADLCI